MVSSLTFIKNEFLKVTKFLFVSAFFSQLNRLQEVSIRDMDVYGTQSDCELSQNTPSIQTLDVSRNLIASWPMVAKICQQLPNLQSLFLRYVFRREDKNVLLCDQMLWFLKKYIDMRDNTAVILKVGISIVSFSKTHYVLKGIL